MSMPHLLTITVIFNRLKVYQLLTCVQKVFLQHPMTTRYSALLIKSSSKHFQVKKSCTSSKEAKNITCKCACLNFIMFSTKDRGSGPNCCFWVCTQNFSTVLSLYFKTCQSDWKKYNKNNNKQQTGNENTQTYQVKVILIRHQILVLVCEEMCGNYRKELTIRSWKLKGLIQYF